MPRLETHAATVTAIERADGQAIWARAQVAGEIDERPIVAYPALTGPLSVGDTVLLNVTATAMNLGTGGVDFVLPSHAIGRDSTGHILKLRYTPLQHAVDAVEMGDTWQAGWHSLEETPVVACLLHSQVALVAAGAKAARPDARIAYVMTDSAALALGFSKLVVQLKDAGLIDATLTCGQAFGGDYECVSLPSALLAARHVAQADVIIVSPGPGMAGTGTPYGFSGIEQAWTLDLATALGGQAIFCLRASEADTRERHRGISHHCRTVLSLCIHRPVLPWPIGFDGAPDGALLADGAPGLALLVEREIVVTSMGRTPEQDPLFFQAASAAGAAAGEKKTPGADFSGPGVC
jgi:hypothetical protein